VVLETEGFGPQPLHGRVGALISEHSTSATEMLTQFAKENALATIIGKRAPGRLASRTAIKIGHGYRLVLPLAAYQSWKGVRIEGNASSSMSRSIGRFRQRPAGQDNQLDDALSVVKSL